MVIAAVLAASLIPLASTDPQVVSSTVPTTAVPRSTTPAPPTLATPAQSATPGLPDQMNAALARLVAPLEADGSVQVGVAVLAVGSDQPVAAGSLPSAPAWSTIKVPLVLAVQHQRSPDQATKDLMVAAITTSDNAAADQLYVSLGNPKKASAMVQQELARHGDPATVVPSELKRAEFSIIGQTEWTLAHAVTFVGTLPCSADAADVWALMGQISPGQRWGLGRVAQARFKGGWGPQADGSYLVRQMGVIITPSGALVAVALAARVSDGNFATGTQTLDRLSASLVPLLATATGAC